MLDIEIVGAIDQQQHYSVAYINNLLLFDSESLTLGTDFVGRPGTRIHANEDDVVKIRTDLKFKKAQARSWIKKTLEKEQMLAVHHPHKTWMLITKPGTGVLIASICPRLMPLHIVLKPAPDSEADRLSKLELLKAVFKMYLTLAATTGHKLDEGLSNFAMSAEGSVYYLDDEYYGWDKFVSFSVMLGVYIRMFEWLDSAFITDLGAILIDLLNDIFQDSHCQAMIARQLQSLFMPTEQKEQLVVILINALTQASTAAPLHSANSAIIYSRSNKARTPERFFALIADIHANYSALDCVLAYLKEHNINQGIVLGDIVGYGPEPKECIERLQDSDFQIIKGNHDHAVAVNNTDTGFSANAKTVINWTVEQLSAEHRDWLKYLPAIEENQEWLAVHGAPMDPAFFYGYVYVMTYQDNLDYMQNKNISLCFHGHSHMPGAFARNKRNQDQHLADKKIALTSYNQALVCPGSVGQPRNDCTDTQFAVYDRELQEVTFLTLPYDTGPVVKKMREHQFPEVLCNRLLVGK